MKPKPDRFSMIHGEHLKLLSKITSATDIKVLLYLGDMIGYQDNKVHLSSEMRKRLCKELDVGPQSLSNALRNLVKADILTGSRDCYEVTPYLYWKGSSLERAKKLKSINKAHGRLTELGGRGELFESHKGEQSELPTEETGEV